VLPLWQLPAGHAFRQLLGDGQTPGEPENPLSLSVHHPGSSSSPAMERISAGARAWCRAGWEWLPGRRQRGQASSKRIPPVHPCLAGGGKAGSPGRALLHRIPAWQGLEGSSVGHLVQPLCQSRITQGRLHRISSRRGLNISREGESSVVPAELHRAVPHPPVMTGKPSLSAAPSRLPAHPQQEKLNGAIRDTRVARPRVTVPWPAAPLGRR